MLKAIAKITFDLNFNTRKPQDGDRLFNKFLTEMKNIDFSHSNPLWRYYVLSDEEKTKEGIDEMASYLPDASRKSPNLGRYQNDVMVFGNRHNAIYPILADMLRWKTGLPSRHPAVKK